MHNKSNKLYPSVHLRLLRDLTVIQDKQTQKVYALKELITEDDFIIKMIENRKKLKHKNLVKMEDYWFSGDQSICSNIRKV